MTVTEGPAARISDPTTSHEAAAKVGKGQVERAYQAARSLSVFTDSHLARRMSQDGGPWVERNIAARRRLDLVRQGRVKPYLGDDGSQRRSKTSHGPTHLVWEVVRGA